MKPISPNEVKQKRIESIPDFVIEATNNLIAKQWDGHRATVKLKDLIAETLRIKPSANSRELFEDHSFDIEPVFRKSGWTVKYDQPAYNEDYDSFYEFTPKKTKEI